MHFFPFLFMKLLLYFPAIFLAGSLSLAQAKTEKLLEPQSAPATPAKSKEAPIIDLLDLPEEKGKLTNNVDSTPHNNQENTSHEATPPPPTSVSESLPTSTKSFEQRGTDNISLRVPTQVILGLLASLLATGLMVLYWHYRRWVERRSLLIAFATELTLAFNRCVLYCKQYATGAASFGPIFNFTDASMVSRLAAVTHKPTLVKSIIELKSDYFQIGRHAEEASKFAFESKQKSVQVMRAKHEIRQIDDERTRETNPTIQRDLELSQNEIKKRLELLLQDEIRLKDLTRHAQGTAIAFFRGNPPEFLNYSQVKNETGEILQTAKKAWIKKGEKRAYEDLEREFTKSHIVFEVIRELTAQNPETQLIRMEDINARVRQAEQ